MHISVFQYVSCMRLEAELRNFAANQLGHVSRAQALALGLTSHEVGRLVASARWTAVTPRVLKVAGLPPLRGDRLVAAVLDQGSGAVLSHTSAAWLWGLGGFSPTEIVLTRLGSSRHRTPLARVHEVRSLPGRWLTLRDGIPVVRPELMMMQLCATLPRGRAERALDNAWRDRMLSGASLIGFLNDHAASGRNGIALLRELTEARGDRSTPPASNLEARVKFLFMGTPLRFVPQADLGDDAWTGRVDFYERSMSLVLEVQSEKYHSSLLDAEHDARRRRDLEDAGFTVIEVTDVELFAAPESLVARVVATYWQLERARRARRA